MVHILVQRPALRYAIAAVFILVWYTVELATYPSSPGRDPLYPLGWWGWFDQSAYLRAAYAILNLDFSPGSHFYPPFYPLLAAAVFPVKPEYGFVIINGLCLLISALILLWVASCTYSRFLSWSVFVATLVLFRPLTVILWVIPWTSSLSAALASTIFAIFFYFSKKPSPWKVETNSDHFLVGLSYFSYGALFATRPLDVVVFFPLALALYWKVMIISISKQTLFDVSKLCGLIALAGLTCPSIYLLFNFLVFGDGFNGYFAWASSNGYYPHRVAQQFVSIVVDSYGLYREANQAIIDRFWPIILGFPVLSIAIFYSNTIIRLISISILLQYILYLPYGDLTPSSVFTFLGAHYFKWTLPWITVIVAGEGVRWGRAIRDSRAARLKLISAIACAVLIAKVKIFASNFVIFPDYRDRASKTISMDFGRPIDFEVLDISDGPPLYSGIVWIDADRNILLSNRDLHMMPAEWGTRIVFSKIITARSVKVHFSKPVDLIKSGKGASRIGRHTYAVWCRFQRCSNQVFERVQVEANPPPRDAKLLSIDLSQGENGERFIGEGWELAESWGRWTASSSASLYVNNAPSGVSGLLIRVAGLVSPMRRRQPFSVYANGCEVVRGAMEFPATQLDFFGSIPIECRRGTDGPLEIRINTDRTFRPKDIGVPGKDDRPLGIGIATLNLLAK